MTWFLILTAFSVSVDSFVCGFSLSLKNKKKLPIILGITLVVFFLCTLSISLSFLLSDLLTEKTASLGGVLLLGVGAYNLVKKPSTKNQSPHGVFRESLITGFAVGTDGAVASLSLSIMGINAFYVLLTVTLMHAVMISLGVCLARIRLIKKFAKIELLPPVILIVLGGYKLLGFFI